MKHENQQEQAAQDPVYLTTNQGVKVDHNDDSLKAGTRGGTLMEDFHFREKMTHFDHERIPERIVHARGSAAHGVFKVYDDSLKQYTKAKFLTDPSIETPVFVRFSTVVGFRGSADTVRDVRGFATKFYTQEGNYDLVGNNMPVFFIQDGIKFPDLVHSVKPEPHHEMPQASAAHDNFWDFISLMPESMHMIMWVLSDRAMPRSYSMMEGFGVHTFRLVNEQGTACFVKFHWKPVAGVHSLLFDEALKIAGKDPDFNRRDLWESIEMGNYPEFEFGVQIIDEKDEFAFDFDVLDATKLWPEELVPLKIIGKMTLNRNPDNFFAETEQAAFHPGHVVPGIDFTNDPLLQARLFSYLDTQLIRLGGPNFSEIPINRPKCPVHNNQRDGFMRQTVNKGRVNYSPNTLAKGCPMTASADNGASVHYMEKVEGHKTRERSPSFKDHFTQAKLFWNSMSAVEQKHMIEGFHFELGKVETMEIRERMVGLLAHIDNRLAMEVAKGIGVKEVKKAQVDIPAKQQGKKTIDIAPTLSMMHTRKDSVKGRMVAILVEDGFDYNEYMSVKVAVEKGFAKAVVISRFHGTVKSKQGNEVMPDKTYITTASVMYDAVYIPGGKDSIEALKKQGYILHFISEAFKHCKPIGATGEAIELIKALNVDQLFSENGPVVSTLGVVMAKDPSVDWNGYTDSFLTAIRHHRHWDREPLTESIPG